MVSAFIMETEFDLAYHAEEVDFELVWLRLLLAVSFIVGKSIVTKIYILIYPKPSIIS